MAWYNASYCSPFVFRGQTVLTVCVKNSFIFPLLGEKKEVKNFHSQLGKEVQTQKLELYSTATVNKAAMGAKRNPLRKHRRKLLSSSGYSSSGWQSLEEMWHNTPFLWCAHCSWQWECPHLLTVRIALNLL